jgi:hypothetical protein
VTSSHEIVPRPGTARRVRDGQPADLTRPSDHPVTAVCKACGRRIRCDRFYLAEWYHLPDEPS